MNIKKICCAILVIVFMSSANGIDINAHDEECNLLHDPQYTQWNIYEVNDVKDAWLLHTADNSGITVDYGDYAEVPEYRKYVVDAVDKWNSAIFTDASGSTNIKMKIASPGSTAHVTFKRKYDATASWGEVNFRQCLANGDYISDPNGRHITYIEVIINEAKVPSSAEAKCNHTFTHELGHVIGLQDVYQGKQLMDGGGIAIPEVKSYDIKGAAVILGIHSNDDHVMGKKYARLNSTQHRNICIYCDGYNNENHTISTRTVTQATCSSTGSKQTYCTKCYEVTKTETIPKTNHSYTAQGSLKTAANCTSPAVYYLKCSSCSAQSTSTMNVGSSLGHSYTSQGSLKTAATCTSPAIYYKKCSRCTSQSTATMASGSALGHNYTALGNQKSAATCTSPAVYYKKCSRCNSQSTQTTTYGSAASHSFGTYKKHTSTRHAVCCSKCGYIGRYESHTWGNWMQTGPSSYICSCKLCGQTKTK